MNRLRKLLAYIPWPVVLVMCATLGLAPFVPEPHIWEKLKMLFAGDLGRPVDIFDFLFHGAPWLLLIIKLAVRSDPPAT
jgi:hypothetical protein